MRAEQFGLNAQDIAVAAGEVQNSFDAGLLLNQGTSDLRTHPRACSRPIRDVDAIDAMFRAQTRAFDLLGRIDAARRQNFHEGHELAGRQFRAELRLRFDWNFRKRLRLRFRRLDYDLGGGVQRLQRPDFAADFLDMLGVVPQHPPTILTPASRNRRAYCDMYSGEHR